MMPKTFVYRFILLTVSGGIWGVLRLSPLEITNGSLDGYCETPSEINIGFGILFDGFGIEIF